MSFTLPGEAGHEAFTLAMAEKWGADVIRDSDGTRLSDEILNSGQRQARCRLAQDPHGTGNEWPQRLLAAVSGAAAAAEKQCLADCDLIIARAHVAG